MTRLLIVEDDAAIRDLYAVALDGFGFEIELAKDGTAAIESIRNNPPDVLLTDFTLPGADGYEICRAMQKAVKRPIVPALIVTGISVDSNRLVHALEIPGVMVAVKPVQVTALPRLLHSLTDHWFNDGTSADQSPAV